ncbi:FecR domain-containing protein [Ruficoccus sp. ZRK36]|uniref:FecR family protein n=1 Tax=Ruficoccus sp. ZRK36 TaxID=2866311 RepID=UPI001C7331E3|nr:FecR domain-containing protein [Ruficoccus sp. ZRK36]QYY34638.1 FecR domain-containing protein [Ruficoccus sp. ZRK36]
MDLYDNDLDFLDLCIRVLSDKATDEDKQTLNRLMAVPGRRDFFLDVKNAWEVRKAPPYNERYEAEVDAAYREVCERVGLDPDLGAEEPALVPGSQEQVSPAHLVEFDIGKPTGSRWSRVMRNRAVAVTLTAAAACFALSAIVSSLWLERPQPDALVAGLPQEILVTGSGQQSSFTLPDGTKVRLNAASKLVVADDFGDGERRVELIGEGFFEVTHDTERPFTVEARGIETRVLGTRFNVRGYPEDSETEITLAQGRVEVRSGENDGVPTVLSPGQQYDYDWATHRQNVQPVNLDHALAWMQNRISFDKEPLPQALRELGRHYGVDFQLMSPELDSQTLSISFNDASLTNVLDGLELTGRLQFERHTENGKLMRIEVFSVK